MKLVARSTLICLLVSLIQPGAQAQSISFDRYHSLTEIEDYLEAVCDNLAGMCEIRELGNSQQGRRILALEIGSTSEKPLIYLNGTHHGNEKSSTEAVLAITDHFVQNWRSAEVQELLETFNILLQPVVNPDGHAANTRADATGRDPNRDYSFPERSDESSFRVPEIDAIRSMIEGRALYAAAAFHSGMEGVLWPWCYTGESTEDHTTLRELSRVFATGMGVRLFQQSYFDYPTRGEFVDFAYMRYGTLAVTVEVSNEPTPNVRRLPLVVERAVMGTRAYLNAVRAYERGELDTRPRFDDRQLALN